MAVSATYATTKKYLERKYQGRIFLTYEEVDLETLGEASMVNFADEDRERFLISDVATYISKEVNDKKTHRARIIAAYCRRLDRYWKNHYRSL